MSQNNGVRLVADAILGSESRTILVGGKPYFLKPPTIKRIAGAGRALAGMQGETMGDILTAMQDTERAAEALSWFVAGNDSMKATFMEATVKEVVDGLSTALQLIGIEDFQRLSGLSRSVLRLIANQKS